MKLYKIVFTVLCYVCINNVSTATALNIYSKDSISAKSHIFEQQSMLSFSLNPAFAGYFKNLSIRTSYQADLLSMVNNPIQYNVGISFGAGKHNNFGYGLSYTSFEFGPEKMKTIEFAISFKKRINKNLFYSFGITPLSLTNREFSDNLTLPDMIDPKFGFIYNTQDPLHSQRFQFLDIKLGSRIIYKSLFLDLSLIHLPLLSIYAPPSCGANWGLMPIEYSLNCGYEINLKNNLLLLPYIQYQKTRYTASNYSIGLTGMYAQNGYAGIKYNSLQTLSLTTGVNIFHNFNLSFSIGTSLNKELQEISKIQSVEIGLCYYLGKGIVSTSQKIKK